MGHLIDGLKAFLAVLIILGLTALMSWANVYHPVGLIIAVVIVIFIVMFHEFIRDGD